MRAPDKLLAIALGGHATMDPHNQDRRVDAQEAYMEGVIKEVMGVSYDASKADYNMGLITHGSGPQTGLIMQRAALSEAQGMHPLPLRYASMDLIGSLGMAFQLMIENYRQKAMDCLGKQIVGTTVVPTSFIIDPETMTPTKPVGAALSDEQIAARVADGMKIGYDIDNKDGKGMRVLVPSPQVLETFNPALRSIAANLRARLAVIGGGTGGVALERLADGKLKARDAVIDKDNAMARIILDLLQQEAIRFHTAAILTDEPYMYRDFTPLKNARDQHLTGHDLERAIQDAQPIHRTTTQEMRALFESKGAVTGGAIAKISSACDLLEAGAVQRAIICSPRNFGATLLASGDGTDIRLGERWV